MLDSHKRPFIIPTGHSSRDAWLRWHPFWYMIFYAMLVFALILSLSEGSHSSESLALLLGLSGLFGVWYAFCIAPLSQYVRYHLLISTGYLIIGWGVWFELTLLDSSYMFLLFGLYPQISFLRPMPWKIVDVLILTALSFWRLELLLRSVDSSLLIILATTGVGILLTLFIEAIIRQSRERQQLIRKLEKAHHELAIAERQAGVTEERQRLAHEIHNTLVQGFTGVVMHLEAAEGVLSTDVNTLHLHLDQARRTARENLAEARRVLWALQPEAFNYTSLSEMLTNLTRYWSEENSISASSIIIGMSRSLRPEIKVTLLRAAQETLTNVSKYAHATQVTLTLSYRENIIVLDVQDNGCGFDTAQLDAFPSKQLSRGFGLKALYERVRQLSGTLSIESTLGEGTTITVTLPALSNEPHLLKQ